MSSGRCDGSRRANRRSPTACPLGGLRLGLPPGRSDPLSWVGRARCPKRELRAPSTEPCRPSAHRRPRGLRGCRRLPAACWRRSLLAEVPRTYARITVSLAARKPRHLTLLHFSCSRWCSRTRGRRGSYPNAASAPRSQSSTVRRTPLGDAGATFAPSPIATANPTGPKRANQGARLPGRSRLQGHSRLQGKSRLPGRGTIRWTRRLR